MKFAIEQATVTQAKAKIAFVGPAGAGKTYTALITAREMGDHILVIDTENGTSAKYANDFDFDILNLPDFKLTTYIAALEYAKDKGYDVMIIDSLSHAWAGPGGALEHVDLAAKKFSGNKFAAWGEVTPLHNKLISIILAYPIHLIATMRMKMDYILTTNDKGKQAPQKVGLGIVQRDGMEYEFDVIAEMTTSHFLTITKTRCFALDGFEADKPDGTLGIAINAWLTKGAEIPVWPDGWHPSKEQFFQRAKGEFGWSFKVIAEKLKAANFSDGYDPKNAAKMWRSLASHSIDSTEPPSAMDEAEAEDSTEPNADEMPF